MQIPWLLTSRFSQYDLRPSHSSFCLLVRVCSGSQLVSSSCFMV